MPSWAASNSLQKRLVKFLLRRTVGQFLKTDFDDENLDVQLSGGQVRLKNVLNDAIADLPIVVSSGTIGLISVSVPWTQLWTGHCELQIEELVIKTKLDSEAESDHASSSVAESDIMNAYGETGKQRSARTNMVESIVGTDGGASILASSVFIADDFLRAETLGYGEKDEIFINKDVERLIANAYEEKAQFNRSRSKAASKQTDKASSSRVHPTRSGREDHPLSPGNESNDDEDAFEECSDSLPHPGSPGGSVKGLQVVSEMVDRIISAINIHIYKVSVECDVVTCDEHGRDVVNTLKLAIDSLTFLDEKPSRKEKPASSRGSTSKHAHSGHRGSSNKSKSGTATSSGSASSDSSSGAGRDHPAGIEYKVVKFRTLQKLAEIKGLRVTIQSKSLASLSQEGPHEKNGMEDALLSGFNTPIQAHLRIHRRMPFSELAPVQPKHSKKDGRRGSTEESVYLGPMPGEFREAKPSEPHPIPQMPLVFAETSESRAQNNLDEDATTSGWDVCLEMGDVACIATKEQLAVVLDIAMAVAPLVKLNAERHAMVSRYRGNAQEKVLGLAEELVPQLARWVSMGCKHAYIVVVPQKTSLLDGWENSSLAVLRLKLETVKHLALYAKGIGAKWESIPLEPQFSESLPQSPTGVPIVRPDSAPPGTSTSYMDTKRWAAMAHEAVGYAREKGKTRGDVNPDKGGEVTINAYVQSISLYDNDPQCYPVVRQLVEIDRSLFASDHQSTWQAALKHRHKNAEKYDVWVMSSKTDLALTVNVGPVVFALNKELSDRLAIYQDVFNKITPLSSEAARMPEEEPVRQESGAHYGNDVTDSIERLMRNLTLQDVQKAPSNIAVCSPLIRTWIQLPTTTANSGSHDHSELSTSGMQSRSHSKDEQPAPGHFCIDAVDAVITNIVNGVATSSQARDEVPDGHMRLPHIQELLESRKNVTGSGIRVECEDLHFYIQSIEGGSSIDHVASVHGPSNVFENIRDAVSTPRPHIEITTVANSSRFNTETSWKHPPAFDAFTAINDDIRVRMAPETELSTSLEFERQAVEQSRLVISCHLPESNIALDRAIYHRLNAVLNEFMLWQSIQEQKSTDGTDYADEEAKDGSGMSVAVLVDMPQMVASIRTGGDIQGAGDFGSEGNPMAASISIPPNHPSNARKNAAYHAANQTRNLLGDGESHRVRLTNTQAFMSNALVEKGKMYISAEANQMRLSSFIDNQEVEAVVSHTFATSESPILTPQFSLYMLTSSSIAEESEIVVKAAWTTFDYQSESSCFRDLESFFSSSGTSGMVQPPPKPMRLSLNVQNSSFRWTPGLDPAINSAVVSLNSLSVIVGINTPAADRDNEELHYYVEGLSVFGRSADSSASVPVDVSSDAWVSTGRFWKDHGYSVLVHMDLVDMSSNSREGDDGPLVDLKLYSEALVLDACADSLGSLPLLAKGLAKELGADIDIQDEYRINEARAKRNRRMSPQVIGQVSDDIFGDIEDDAFAASTPTPFGGGRNIPGASASRRSSMMHVASSHSAGDDYSFTHDFENGQDDIDMLLVDEYFAPNEPPDDADEYEVVGGKALSPTSPKHPTYSRRRQSAGHNSISSTSSKHRNKQQQLYTTSSRSPNDKAQPSIISPRKPLDIKPAPGHTLNSKRAAGKATAGSGDYDSIDGFNMSDENEFGIDDCVNMDSGSDILSADDDMDFLPNSRSPGYGRRGPSPNHRFKLQNRLPGQQFAGDDSVLLEPEFPAPTFIPRTSGSRQPSRASTAIDILGSNRFINAPVIVTIPEEPHESTTDDASGDATEASELKDEAKPKAFGIIDNYFKTPAAGELSSEDGDLLVNGSKTVLRLALDIARVEVNLHSGQDWFESVEPTARASPIDPGYMPSYMDRFDDSISTDGAGTTGSRKGRVSASMPERRVSLDFSNSPLGSPHSPYRQSRAPQHQQQQQSRSQRRSVKPKIELHATHVHAEYRHYSEASKTAYDFGVNVSILEILDQLESSEWSKFLTRRREPKTGLPATLHSLATVRNRQLLISGTADSDRVTGSSMRHQKSGRWPDSSVEPMICIQVESVRPYDSLKTEELRVDVEVSPLRCYIHQDALDFLISFFETAERRSLALSGVKNADAKEDGARGAGMAAQRDRVFGQWGSKGANQPYFQIVRIAPLNVIFDYKPRKIRGLSAGSGGGSSGGKPSSVDGKPGAESSKTTGAIKSGSPGYSKPVELLNLFPLEDAEMTLSTVKVRGVAGISKLVRELGKAWLPHLTQTQIPGVVSGLTPLRSLVNIGSGVADLVILPIEQYRKDGRLVQGIKRGAQAFARTTTLEALQLGAKVAVNAQTLLEQAGDILNVDVNNSGDSGGSGPHSHDSSWPDGAGGHTPHSLEAAAGIGGAQRQIEVDLADWPDYMSVDGHGIASIAGTEYSMASGSGGGSGSRARRGSFNRSKYARQPENFSEGMRQAYTSLRSNMGSAMQTILAIPVVVQESTVDDEDEYAGDGTSGRTPVHGSVRAVVRAVPVAVLKPMIGATEAVSKTLLGLRNTMEPSRRGQLEDKYKSRSLGAKKSYPS
ncbi:autophagy- protein 2 [Coemansia sp. RSA 1646]|nr:autophagy- protein 2 [Coemansia sp. RSA 1646]